MTAYLCVHEVGFGVSCTFDNIGFIPNRKRRRCECRYFWLEIYLKIRTIVSLFSIILIQHKLPRDGEKLESSFILVCRTEQHPNLICFLLVAPTHNRLIVARGEHNGTHSIDRSCEIEYTEKIENWEWRYFGWIDYLPYRWRPHRRERWHRCDWSVRILRRYRTLIHRRSLSESSPLPRRDLLTYSKKPLEQRSWSDDSTPTIPIKSDGLWRGWMNSPCSLIERLPAYWRLHRECTP